MKILFEFLEILFISSAVFSFLMIIMSIIKEVRFYLWERKMDSWERSMGHPSVLIIKKEKK